MRKSLVFVGLVFVLVTVFLCILAASETQHAKMRKIDFSSPFCCIKAVF